MIDPGEQRHLIASSAPSQWCLNYQLIRVIEFVSSVMCIITSYLGLHELISLRGNCMGRRWSLVWWYLSGCFLIFLGVFGIVVSCFIRFFCYKKYFHKQLKADLAVLKHKDRKILRSGLWDHFKMIALIPNNIFNTFLSSRVRSFFRNFY